MLVLRNVHLALEEQHDTPRQLFDVIIRDDKVESVSNVLPSNSSFAGDVQELDAKGGLLLPSLCHAHIHLDKCYLLDRCTLAKGDFPEALKVTAKAKSNFSQKEDDLYARGKRLVLNSVAAGVTSMRAHVEVDTTVQYSCLEVGQRLKADLEALCDIRLCAFAQDPLYPNSSSSDPGENHHILRSTASNSDVSSVGSAPYVEPTLSHAQLNIRLVLDLAQTHGLHADFHLDYNLDPSSEPLIWYLLTELTERISEGTWNRAKRVCVGHATRLTLFTPTEWQRLASIIKENDLPISFVGLPQSDVYMMGRDAGPSPPRGTLNVVKIAAEHGLDMAMAVNNIQNAFTPQGSPDPLALCTLGVALFHAGTKESCRTLIQSVTVHAKTAIGHHGSRLVPQVGNSADFVLLHDNEDLQSAACDSCYTRTTIKAGRIVSRRKGEVQFEHP